MEDTITVLVDGEAYEVTPRCSVADLEDRVECLKSPLHVRGEDREYVLPNDTVLSECVETGARLTVVPAPG
jgi:Mg-chelatase subunit ChlI